MSSKYVRDEFEASWPGLVPSIPLFDTINNDPDHSTMPDLWATVEYSAFNESPQSLGQPSCRREDGTITVILNSRSGETDSVLNDASETIRTAYRYWAVSAATESMRVTQVDPPISPGGFSDGYWYSFDIDISYDYDRFV